MPRERRHLAKSCGANHSHLFSFSFLSLQNRNKAEKWVNVVGLFDSFINETSFSFPIKLGIIYQMNEQTIVEVDHHLPPLPFASNVAKKLDRRRANIGTRIKLFKKNQKPETKVNKKVD